MHNEWKRNHIFFLGVFLFAVVFHIKNGILQRPLEFMRFVQKNKEKKNHLIWTIFYSIVHSLFVRLIHFVKKEILRCAVLYRKNVGTLNMMQIVTPRIAVLIMLTIVMLLSCGSLSVYAWHGEWCVFVLAVGFVVQKKNFLLMLLFSRFICLFMKQKSNSFNKRNRFPRQKHSTIQPVSSICASRFRCARIRLFFSVFISACFCTEKKNKINKIKQRADAE